MGFVRFVGHDRDPNSQVRTGIFHLAGKLRDEGVLKADEARELRDLRDWFDQNLARPDRFSRKRNPSQRGNRGIAWFKDSATIHIANIRKIATILEAHGIQVEMIATQKPGYVYYEDDFHVVAEPFTETRT